MICGPLRHAEHEPRRRRASVQHLLDLFGGADPGIPPEQIDELARRLSEAGVEHEFHAYPGARRQEEYAEVSEDAWRRVLAFLRVDR